jgi:hypothetical protein
VKTGRSGRTYPSWVRTTIKVVFGLWLAVLVTLLVFLIVALLRPKTGVEIHASASAANDGRYTAVVTNHEHHSVIANCNVSTGFFENGPGLSPGDVFSLFLRAGERQTVHRSLAGFNGTQSIDHLDGSCSTIDYPPATPAS